MDKYSAAYDAGRFEVHFHIITDRVFFWVIEKIGQSKDFVKWGPIVSKSLARKLVEERKLMYEDLITRRIKDMS